VLLKKKRKASNTEEHEFLSNLYASSQLHKLKEARFAELKDISDL
jgi:hypothetical protein